MGKAYAPKLRKQTPSRTCRQNSCSPCHQLFTVPHCWEMQRCICEKKHMDETLWGVSFTSICLNRLLYMMMSLRPHGPLGPLGVPHAICWMVGMVGCKLLSKLGALWHPWHRGKASVPEATTAVSLTRRRWKIRKWTWWLLELPFLEKTSFNGRLILREYCLNINGLFMWFEAASIFFVSFPCQ